MKAHQKILEREKQGSNDPLYSAILLKRCLMQNNADPFLQYPKEKQTQKKRGERERTLNVSQTIKNWPNYLLIQ